MDKEVLSIKTAERLKELRKENNLSHEKLRNALYEKYGIEISRASLLNYEVTDPKHSRFGMNTGMKIEYAQCLADFYGVSTDYLLGLSEVPSADTELTAVCKYTGLSKDAVQQILMLKKGIDAPASIDTLNHILLAGNFSSFICGLANIEKEIGAVQDTVSMISREEKYNGKSLFHVGYTLKELKYAVFDFSESCREMAEDIYHILEARNCLGELSRQIVEQLDGE